jgi:hypothetical protein
VTDLSTGANVSPDLSTGKIQVKSYSGHIGRGGRIFRGKFVRPNGEA